MRVCFYPAEEKGMEKLSRKVFSKLRELGRSH